ncbi:hypothetical protein, partial [uncultured Megasphaera sp.]|uniref:hypothetical protein n=1 Tax=uncultured Megasphaera sp. TaxID=165188 RepID=UPI0025ED4208
SVKDVLAQNVNDVILDNVVAPTRKGFVACATNPFFMSHTVSCGLPFFAGIIKLDGLCIKFIFALQRRVFYEYCAIYESGLSGRSVGA